MAIVHDVRRLMKGGICVFANDDCFRGTLLGQVEEVKGGYGRTGK